MAEAPDPTTSANMQIGATITHVYVGRQLKTFAVLENEVNSFTFFNSQATIFFSVGSFLSALAAGIWTNSAFAEKLNAVGEMLTKVGAPLILVLGLIFFLMGYKAMRSRSALWKVIQEESKSNPQA